MPAKPNGLTIRSYQVGFGDCFLLTFHYPPADGSGDRNVLIDFGSTGAPKKGAPAKMMESVANDIAAVCAVHGGKLHAVVATHRHKDHISGFARNGDKGTGAVIRSLKPDVVLQPWTEDPKAARDAKKPALRMTGNLPAVAALGEMQNFAAQALEELQVRPGISRNLKEEIRFIADDGLANLSAIKNLATMGKRQEYLSYGDPTELSELLPGVKITVLGPPTLEQAPDIETERQKDASEFWHFQAAAVAHTASGKRLFPHAPRYRGTRLPEYARWFAPRLSAIRADQLLEIARSMDDALNNTSLILLFQVAGKKFLFPGDAQIENWLYALKDAPHSDRNRETLKEVDFYKVGHHGSLNATPKTLWNLFDKKSKAKKSTRLRTAVSTMAGKHGKVSSGTEVPRSKLVAELEDESDFFTTQSLTKETDAAKKLSHDIVFSF